MAILLLQAKSGSYPDDGGGFSFDTNGNLIVARGYSYSSNNTNSTQNGILVTKYNSSGSVIWTNTYIYDTFEGNDTSVNNYEAHDVAVDSLGNIYVIGQHWNENWSSGQSVSTSTIFIQKLSSGGGAGWYQDYFPNENDQWVNELIVGSDDNLYFVETDVSSVGYSSRVVKVDSRVGNTVWFDTYYPSEDALFFLYDVAQDSSGRIYVTGYDYPGVFTAAYANDESDPNGERIWQNQVNLSLIFHGSNNNSSGSYSVTIDNSNTLWLLVFNGASDGFFTPMDPDGNFK